MQDVFVPHAPDCAEIVGGKNGGHCDCPDEDEDDRVDTATKRGAHVICASNAGEDCDCPDGQHLTDDDTQDIATNA